MIISKMSKIFVSILALHIFFYNFAYATQQGFDTWLNNFKVKAINNGISKEVVDDVMSGARFLPKVIEYDRFQPEFYEDTFTYIKKRSSKKKN